MRRKPIDTQEKAAGPIDAVITWVNGSAETHLRDRSRYMAEAHLPLHENAINPHRWDCSDEILYCLQSIENYAPWTRKIWIVVDDEVPELLGLSDELRTKIRFVFHRDIFNEFCDVLPTFNSLAIESMLWRIDGLSECFMYFNDDVFLTAPLLPTDVFQDEFPILRGHWVDYSALLRSPEISQEPAKFNHFMQINAATLAGFEANRLFCAAHVVHPLRRTVMASLFDQYSHEFMNNIKYRFRDLSQFLPQGLHNHACIAAGTAVIHTDNDHLHIRSGQGAGGSSTETRSLLQDAVNSNIKFLCVNDLPQLEEVIPEVRQWLRRMVGGSAALEREP